MCANLLADQPVAREGYVSVDKAELFYREIGQGQPIIVLHGGPDFDQSYLLPDMDRLADSFRLIYYDQRGRGKSARNVQPEDVTWQSDIGDVNAIREYLGLETVAVLGHSFGGVIAMEYAIRCPQHISRLILMNSAPASHDDYMLFRQIRSQSAAGDLEKMKAIAATAKYEEGDPETIAAYYRIHFSSTLRQAEQLDRMMEGLALNFTNEGILKARAIEDRLMDETWLVRDFNLPLKLNSVRIPTLVIHGDYDFIPVEFAAHIAEAIPGARLVVLQNTGHFAYIESPDEIHKEMVTFFCAT